LDEEQHQQAAGEVEKVRNSVTHKFRHFRWYAFIAKTRDIINSCSYSGHPHRKYC